MEPPPVQYVRTSDGYSVAYAVAGTGIPYVYMPFSFCHVQLAWEFPSTAPWLEELAGRFRLVQYDPRGSGMSSRGLSKDHTAEDMCLDLEAVVDQLALDRFVLH